MKDLNAALRQLQQYALALENPQLLIVSDMETIEIHTHFPNTVNVVHRLTLDDLADHAHRTLNATVAAAYGWPADLSDDEVLRRLLALNRERTR